jgi:acetylornithine deacetylase/succinyl-diaminopimelate desuccinylase-like protein
MESRGEMIDPVGLLQELVRIDTTNPPGNETGAFKAECLEQELLSKDPRRANTIVRIPGRGLAPPLLMHGHLDVVPATDQH